MTRCLIFVVLSALVIIGNSLSSPAGDISDGASSDSFGTIAAESAQPVTTGKTSVETGAVPKSSDADVGGKSMKSESTSALVLSSEKTAELNKEQKLQTLLPQRFDYRQYVEPTPIISRSSLFRSVQPIHFVQPLANHVLEPFVTVSHLSTPVAEHFVSKPSYTISHQVIREPVITEVQEVVHKPVIAELHEVVHKPILTEVQQVIKRPIYTEHIVKHPSFSNIHQQVVEQQPVHLQTQQYHIVTKPLSHVVQLPTRHLVQQSIVQPVISNHIVSSPISDHLTGGLSPYGSLNHGPLNLPWSFTKPLTGLSGSSSAIGGLVASSTSSASSPVISSLPSPVLSSVSLPVVTSVQVSPALSSEFSHPSHGLPSSFYSHSGELQFLTPSTCRSGSCGSRAADSNEIPSNSAGSGFTDSTQNDISYYFNGMIPQAKFLRVNSNGDNGNAVTAERTKSFVGSAESASPDVGDNNSKDSRYIVPVDTPGLNLKPQEQYTASKSNRMVGDKVKRTNDSSDNEDKKLQDMLKKLLDNPAAIKDILTIIKGVMNSGEMKA